MMTREELLQLHKDTCQAGYAMMAAKNADYTGGSDDPFANFRATEMLGIPAELGILTRCLDKFQRIRSFVAKGELQVKGESVDDAIEDVINYMVLLKGVIKERGAENEVADGEMVWAPYRPEVRTSPAPHPETVMPAQYGLPPIHHAPSCPCSLCQLPSNNPIPGAVPRGKHEEEEEEA